MITCRPYQMLKDSNNPLIVLDQGVTAGLKYLRSDRLNLMRVLQDCQEEIDLAIPISETIPTDFNDEEYPASLYSALCDKKLFVVETPFCNGQIRQRINELQEGQEICEEILNLMNACLDSKPPTGGLISAMYVAALYAKYRDETVRYVSPFYVRRIINGDSPLKDTLTKNKFDSLQILSPSNLISQLQRW